MNNLEDYRIVYRWITRCGVLRGAGFQWNLNSLRLYSEQSADIIKKEPSMWRTDLT